MRDLGASGDDATYLALSHSLEHARYHEEYLVDAPPHGKYPPGFPALLAVTRQVAGTNLDVVRLENLFLLALTATLVGDAVRRLGGAWLGVGAAAATAFNPTLLRLAGEVFAEIPYVALATVAVWATLPAEQEQRRRWSFLAGGAALAGFLTRSIGITLLVGVIGWAVLRRRTKMAVLLAGISTLVVGGWFAWARRVAAVSSGQTYFGEVAAIGQRGVGSLIHRVARNLASASQSSFEVLGLPMLKHTIVDNLFWVFLFAPPALIGFWLLLRKWPSAVLTLAVSLPILLVWTGVEGRLLAPLIPTTVAAILLGGSLLADRLPRTAPLGAALLPTALVSLGLFSLLRADRQHLCGRDPYASDRCLDPASRGVVLAAWLVRDSLPQDVVVVTSKPSTLSYFSGHKTRELTPILRSAGADGGAPIRLAGMDYLLLTRMDPFEERQGRAIVRAHCAEFSVRASFLSTAILLMPRDPRSLLPNACSALAQFATEPVPEFP